MRQVVLDTETTGLDPAQGHRIIEVGCVEIVNRRVTDRTFHYYLNPEREVDAGALQVHGISNEFLADKPRFADVAREMLEFLAGAELLIHNAAFDVSFLNHELAQLSQGLEPLERHCTVTDTRPRAPPREEEQSGRALPELWRGQFAPGPARGPARCAVAGRGLPCDDGGPGHPVPGPQGCRGEGEAGWRGWGVERESGAAGNPPRGRAGGRCARGPAGRPGPGERGPLPLARAWLVDRGRSGLRLRRTAAPGSGATGVHTPCSSVIDVPGAAFTPSGRSRRRLESPGQRV